MQATAEPLRFAEAPLDLVARTNEVAPLVHVIAKRDGVRVFDASVADGLVRATVSPRSRGKRFWLVCVAHRPSFHQGGKPIRVPTDRETASALDAIRRRMPELPGLVESRTDASRWPYPLRAFIEVPS